jgi:hypothetical protein
LNDPSGDLIPVSGGSGGYGQGQQVMKARNAGEARWAKNMAREGREWRAREAHKTRVGFVHNSQKRELAGWQRGRQVLGGIFSGMLILCTHGYGIFFSDWRDHLLQ